MSFAVRAKMETRLGSTGPTVSVTKILQRRDNSVTRAWGKLRHPLTAMLQIQKERTL
jgi:hypothetical protein